MAAASSGRAEVDTSCAFRSVKEAVVVFGERIIARETQVRLGARADSCVVKERRSPWRDAVAIVSSNEKLEGSRGVRPSDFIREIHSNPSTIDVTIGKHAGNRSERADHCVVRERSSWRDVVAIASSNEKFEGRNCVRPSDLIRGSHTIPSAITVAIAKHEGSRSERATHPTPVSYAQPMCLIPLSPPLSASSQALAHSDDKKDRKEASLVIMSSIKKVEEEATKTRQEAVQLKKRLAELELAMANLNAKLHRALSKLAHMEGEKAAAARATIEQRDNYNNTVALAIWSEPKLEQEAPRRPLGQLLSLDDGDEEVIHVQRRETPTMKRKVQKQKPIVPLVVPLINGMLFSKKKEIKDKESLYVKELYSLLRLT